MIWALVKRSTRRERFGGRKNDSRAQTVGWGEGACRGVEGDTIKETVYNIPRSICVLKKIVNPGKLDNVIPGLKRNFKASEPTSHIT